MSQQQNHEEGWETSVQNRAKDFSYPATPDIATNVGKLLRLAHHRNTLRLMARAAAMVILILIALLFVPEIRAGVLEILRVGAIRILPQNPTSTIVVSPPGPLSLVDLNPVASLGDAQDIFGLPIRLPTNVRAPDRIFMIENSSAMIIFVWLVPGTENQIEMSLHILRSEDAADKYYPWQPEDTSVNGSQAFWLVNAHVFDFYGMVGDERADWTRYVDMNVLIWEHNFVTYRLETDLTLEEAIQIAESLQEVSP
jgi:hypothetical protein